MFEKSIVSYERRGFGGDHRYRGNCSPRFVRDYLLKFNQQRGLTIDPMAGGNTVRDVCADMGIPYRGFDLRHGFDSRRMNIREQLERPARCAFVHPPYLDMIEYSKTVWPNGTEHPADLSRTRDVEQFLAELQEVLYNVFDALEVGGVYGILLGLVRHAGNDELIHLPARIFPYCPGTFVNEIVKDQQRTQSHGKSYAARDFVHTTHETFFVFRKTEAGLVGSIVRTAAVAEALAQDTWLTMIRSFVRTQKRFTNDDVYRAFRSHPRAKRIRTFDATIRRNLQELVESGELERLGVSDYLRAA